MNVLKVEKEPTADHWVILRLLRLIAKNTPYVAVGLDYSKSIRYLRDQVGPTQLGQMIEQLNRSKE